MSEKGAAIARFNSKIENLERETGCSFQIEYPGFEDFLERNRLFADWFEPGTVLARAVKGDTVITYDIVGTLEARIDAPDGAPVQAFSGWFYPITLGELSLGSDDDLIALSDGSHTSGCRAYFDGHNSLRISVNDESVGPIISTDPSVARGILKANYISELLSAADRAAAFDEDGYSSHIDAKTAEKMREKVYELEPAEENAPDMSEQNASKAALEKAKAAIEKGSLSSDDEKADKKKAKKSEKAEKKPAKSGKKAPASKKTKASSDDASGGRFDLLPLDIVSEYIDRFDDAEEGDFFKDIEKYKKNGKGLLDAAVSFGKGYYPADSTDAVLALAEAFEKSASENGEDAWKEQDARHYINLAVRSYLMFLREGCSEECDHILDTLFALFCGAWIEKNA